jgi:hypothetical protein
MAVIHSCFSGMPVIPTILALVNLYSSRDVRYRENWLSRYRTEEAEILLGLLRSDPRSTCFDSTVGFGLILGELFRRQRR